MFLGHKQHLPTFAVALAISYIGRQVILSSVKDIAIVK